MQSVCAKWLVVNFIYFNDFIEGVKYTRHEKFLQWKLLSTSVDHKSFANDFPKSKLNFHNLEYFRCQNK